MPIAFVLIGIESGSEHEVIEQLKKLGTVKDAYSVYGVYDVVVKLDGKSEKELKETITYKIRAMPKIKSTQTLMVFD